MIQAVVCGFFQVRIIDDECERPTSGLLGGFGMDDVEDALRFVVVQVFGELPAFDYRAAIGNFHAIEIILDDRGVFFTGGFWRDGHWCCGLAGSGSWCLRCS